MAKELGKIDPDNWFVGNSNGYNKRNAQIDFSFLDKNKKYTSFGVLR